MLLSNKDQTLTLRCRKDIKSFKVNGINAKVNGDHILFAFKAGEKVLVEICF
jgi:hypothetical protein